MNSNLHLNELLLPIGVMNVISILPLLFLAPLMEMVTTCYLYMKKTPVVPPKVIGRLCFVFVFFLIWHTRPIHTRSKCLNGFVPLALLFLDPPSFLPSSPVIVPKPPLSLPLPVHPPFAAMGHGCATLSVLVAALSELQRKSYTLVEQTLSGKVLQVSSMPCFQLAPQYILLGLAEALVTPACERWRPALFNGVLGSPTQLQKPLSRKTQRCIFSTVGPLSCKPTW